MLLQREPIEISSARRGEKQDKTNIGAVKQHDEAVDDVGNGHNRLPAITQDIEADFPLKVNVWMVDWRRFQNNDRRLMRVGQRHRGLKDKGGTLPVPIQRRQAECKDRRVLRIRKLNFDAIALLVLAPIFRQSIE